MSEEKRNIENEEGTDGFEERHVDETEINESNAARRLRMLGISSEEESAHEPVAKVGFIENLWYHYKSMILAVTAGVIILAIGISQLVSRGDPRYYFMYAGPTYYDASGTDEFLDALCEVADCTHGEIALVQTTCYTEEKIDALRKQYEEAGLQFSFDTMFNNDEYERYRNEFMVGSSMIFLLDPELYEEMSGRGIFMKIEDVLGYVPDCAYDECAIRFCELEFAGDNQVFGEMPDDTLLAVRSVSSVAVYSYDRDEVQSRHCALFKSIVEYTSEDK